MCVGLWELQLHPHGTKLSYVAQKMSYVLFLIMAGAPLHMLEGQNQ